MTYSPSYVTISSIPCLIQLSLEKYDEDYMQKPIRTRIRGLVISDKYLPLKRLWRDIIQLCSYSNNSNKQTEHNFSEYLKTIKNFKTYLHACVSRPIQYGFKMLLLLKEKRLSRTLFYLIIVIISATNMGILKTTHRIGHVIRKCLNRSESADRFGTVYKQYR